MNLNLMKHIVMITILANLCRAQICIRPKGPLGSNECTLYFSQECIFQYCTFKACSNHSAANCPLTQILNSTNFAFCRNSCDYVTYSQTTSRDWVAITIIIFSILTSILLCTCAARRCCKDDEERYQNEFRVRPPSAEQNQIYTDRRLSSWNYLDFQLKWQNNDANNAQWINQEQACVICLQKELHCCLPCRHYYHKNCIKEWLKQKNTCPTCKSQDFHQIILRCKVCKIMRMSCFVQQLKIMLIQDKCPNCQ